MAPLDISSLTDIDQLLPDLFSKTFFIVGAQLLITWLATHVFFIVLRKADPQLSDDTMPLADAHKKLNPHFLWAFSPIFFYGLLIADIATFLTLLFWGAHQPLPVAFTLFSFWSIITGIELDYCFLGVAHGIGRKVMALTALAVVSTALIGIYSKVSFGWLKIPLFIALSVLIVIQTIQLFGGMQGVKQRLLAGFGVVIFTLYLVFDFGRLAEKEAAGENSWAEAMQMSIKIYLDIINLILQLLKLLGKGHH